MADSFTTLLTAADLQAHLFDPNWCIVDCRHDLFDTSLGARVYREGHIPGAVFASVDDDLSGAKNGRNGRHPLPDRDALVARFRAWGIGNDTQIVAYDAQGGQYAGRVWWLARWLGHPGVAVLDGGWQAWMAHANWSSVEAPERKPRQFDARAPLVRVVEASELLAGVASRSPGDTVLVDVRAPERFRGEQEPIDPVAGHIPGAVNRFWQQNLDADGRFKSAAQLRSELAPIIGSRSPSAVVAQCGSGVTGCHLLLSMEIAGLSGAALYAGSWSEWIADPSRPIALGGDVKSEM